MPDALCRLFKYYIYIYKFMYNLNNMELVDPYVYLYKYCSCFVNATADLVGRVFKKKNRDLRQNTNKLGCFVSSFKVMV